MKIQEFHNITQQEIDQRKNNIFIPICLGNKFFMKANRLREDNLLPYFNWALEHTKEKVLFIVADKIQATNYDVRNHDKSAYNLRRVIRDGKQVKENLKKLVDTVPTEKQNDISVMCWEEFSNQDKYCRNTTKQVHDLFSDDGEFRNKIYETTRATVTDRPFSDEQYMHLSKYILDEFSLAYNGIHFSEVQYGLYIYPRMDAAANFFEELKSKKIFAGLTSRLPSQTVGLAVLR